MEVVRHFVFSDNFRSAILENDVYPVLDRVFVVRIRWWGNCQMKNDQAVCKMSGCVLKKSVDLEKKSVDLEFCVWIRIRVRIRIRKNDVFPIRHFVFSSNFRSAILKNDGLLSVSISFSRHFMMG